MIKAIDPALKFITTEYNSDELPVETTDQEGKSATVEYDNEGRVISSVDGAGNTTSYTYDESPVLCKNSSACKAAIHAGLAEKWSWNFIQKSVIENDVF